MSSVLRGAMCHDGQRAREGRPWVLESVVVTDGRKASVPCSQIASKRLAFAPMMALNVAWETFACLRAYALCPWSLLLANDQ